VHFMGKVKSKPSFLQVKFAKAPHIHDRLAAGMIIVSEGAVGLLEAVDVVGGVVRLVECVVHELVETLVERGLGHFAGQPQRL